MKNKKLIWNIILVVISVFIILFIIFLFKDVYHLYNKEVKVPKLLPAIKKSLLIKEDTISSDTLCYNFKIINKDSIILYNNNFKGISKKNAIDNFLNHTSNILSDTENILTYITIFFALVGIIGSIALSKYFITINKLERDTEELKNKMLDAAMTTLSAVPLAEVSYLFLKTRHKILIFNE